ncbi:MAG: biosis protein MshL [Campylobacterota bacterium]|nr:biosis protein MshL [Campylobacterota bacterium]
MAYIVSIILLLLVTGCSNHNFTDVKNPNMLKTKSANQEIEAFNELHKKRSVPPIILPSIYEEVSIFDEQKITFSAQEAKFSQVMYQISEQSGLNLIIDKDVDVNTSITIAVNEASLKEAIDIIMNISGCYYQLKGNILHVKQFEQKNFIIPYVHTTSSFKTELGGDTLSSASGGGGSSGGSSQGLKGEFKLSFDNPQEINNFYEQLDKNIASLISADGKYTLNKFSGTLNVYDRKKNIDAIEDVIDKIKKQSNQQVVIEAKILEIVLNDSHALGVDWSDVANSVLQSGDQLQLSQTLGLTGAVAGTMSYTSRNFSAVINALDESGDVDTLSNPSINVLSGQSAMISSGKLVPFWEKEVQTTQGTGGSASTSEVTYNRRDVLDGVTMGVTPTIMEDGKIMLNVVPVTSSIEEIVDYKDEGGASVATAPVLNIKEAGTIIYAQDNSLVLIGGLINNTIKKQESKVPLLGDLPYLGALFTKTVNSDEKRELVILIRLKIVE